MTYNIDNDIWDDIDLTRVDNFFKTKKKISLTNT